MLAEVQKTLPCRYISNSERTIMRIVSLKKNKEEMIMNEPQKLRRQRRKKCRE
jgi:hypothetical protein